MTEVSSMKAPLRLSWGANGPLPYESVWMIFVKLVALNLLTPRTLARLLAKDAEAVPLRGPLDVVSSAWVDISRLARAIDIPEERLRSAFLDQLGLGELAGSGSIIRHCPACIQNGFHCVLFQLAVVASCPLHGLQLVECKGCSSFRFTAGRRPGNCAAANKSDSVDGPPRGTALACGHFSFLHSGSTTFPKVAAAESERMAEKCQEILGWAHRARAGMGEDAQLLDGLWGTWSGPNARSATKFPNEVLDIKLALACKIAGRIPFDSTCDIADEQELIGWSDEPGSLDSEASGTRVQLAYRLVRRHIETHYLTGHRQCTQAFRRFDRWDCLILCGVHACTPNLAYFAWRMRHEGAEGTAGIEGFPSWKKSTPCCPVLHGPSLLWKARSLRAVCHLLLASFISLWGAIDSRCGWQSLRLRWPIYDEYRSAIPDHLYLKCASDPKPYRLGQRFSAFNGLGRCSIAIPARQLLIASAAKRCDRRPSDKAFFSLRGKQSVYYWAYDDDQSDIFRVWRDSDEDNLMCVSGHTFLEV